MTDRQGLQSGSVSEEAGPLLRSRAARVGLLVLGAILIAGFFSLGTWQVYRLQWKLALIERVDQRAHAEPVAAPGIEQWQQVTADSDEYRRVSVQGRFLYLQSALTQATTDLGAGFWVLTPLRDDAGNITFINRGFVTEQTAVRLRRVLAGAEHGLSVDEAVGEPVKVTGLLRISEPGGGFLRKNAAGEDRWHSRDVLEIAAVRGLSPVAPYFIDADAQLQVNDPLLASDEQPAGGLTVIAFHNNHLVYALTWYALALMVVAALVWILRRERKTEKGAAVSVD